MKNSFLYVILSFMLFQSCEESTQQNQVLVPEITILYPQDNSSIICEECIRNYNCY